jgi:hypothetical protein
VASPLLLAAAVTAFFGVMRAHGFRTELVVDTRLYESLVGINLAGAAAAGTALLVAALSGGRWPRHLLSQRVAPQKKPSSSVAAAAAPPRLQSAAGGGNDADAAIVDGFEGEAEEGDDSLAALSLARLRNLLAATAASATAAAAAAGRGGRGTATVHPDPSSSAAASSSTSIEVAKADKILEATRRRILVAIERSAAPPASSSSASSPKKLGKPSSASPNRAPLSDPSAVLTASDIARLEYTWIRAIREARRELSSQLSPTRPLLMVDVQRLAAAAAAVAPHFAHAFACRTSSPSPSPRPSIPCARGSARRTA